MRRAHRLDSNHAELVSAFEKLGCSVLSLAGIGAGCPDVIVGFGGLQMMCELKDGAKPPSARRLTPDEERFKMNWRGGYRIVMDLDGVEETVALLKNWHAAIRDAIERASIRKAIPDQQITQAGSGITPADGARALATLSPGDPSL